MNKPQVRPKSGNVYREGSWFHEVFARLISKPGKKWTVVDLFRGIGYQDQERMIAFMKSHGKTGERGYKFVIEWTPDGCIRFQK